MSRMVRSGGDGGRREAMAESSLKESIERYFAAGADAIGDDEALGAFIELRHALEDGMVRAAEPDSASLQLAGG
jgi:hypothetical protein